MLHILQGVQRDFLTQLKTNQNEFENHAQDVYDKQLSGLEESAKTTDEVTDQRRTWMNGQRDTVLLDLTNQSMSSRASTIDQSLVACEQNSAQHAQ